MSFHTLSSMCRNPDGVSRVSVVAANNFTEGRQQPISWWMCLLLLRPWRWMTVKSAVSVQASGVVPCQHAAPNPRPLLSHRHARGARPAPRAQSGKSHFSQPRWMYHALCTQRQVCSVVCDLAQPILYTAHPPPFPTPPHCLVHVSGSIKGGVQTSLCRSNSSLAVGAGSAGGGS